MFCAIAVDLSIAAFEQPSRFRAVSPVNYGAFSDATSLAIEYE